MYVMVRIYSGKGASELCDLLLEKQGDVMGVIGVVQGFTAYRIIRTADGCMTITVCDDKVGTDESLSRAMDWLKAHAAHLNLAPPLVTEGTVAFSTT